MKKKSFLLIASLALVSTLGLSTLASCGETSSVAPSTSAPDTPTSEAPTTEESPKVTQAVGIDSGTFDVKGLDGGGSGAFSYAAESYDVKTQILGKLEAYAYSNALTGLPLFENGGYVMYNSRITKGSENYIPGYGFGILGEGTITADLPTETKTEWKRYLHASEVSDPASINALDTDGSQIMDLNSYISSSYWEVRMRSDKKGYEWYGNLAKEDKPVAVNPDPATGMAQTWKFHVRTGADGLKYRTGSSKRTAFDNRPVELEDYVNAFKVLLTKKNNLYRGAEMAGKNDYSGIKGAGTYYNASANGFDAEAWKNVGVKSGTDEGGEYLEITLAAPTTQFYAMYALSSQLYTPIPEAFIDEIGGIENYGKYSSDKSTAPIDNILSLAPYTLEYWQEDQVITFKKNDSWFGLGLDGFRNRYTIPGIKISIIKAAASDPNAVFKEFLANKLDSAGIPSDYLDQYKNDPRATTTTGDSVFKLNINSTTEEQWEALFGEHGSVARTAKGDYWNVKPWMSNKNFLDGLMYSINRKEIAEKYGSNPSCDYFGAAYMSDPENGQSYNGTKEHEAALIEAGLETAESLKGTKLYGYRLEVAKEKFSTAINELKTAGKIKDGDTLEIDIWWMYPQHIKRYGADVKTYLETAFNTSAAAKSSNIKLQVNNDAVETWSDVYYKHLMVGQFDLGFGSISGNTLNPLNFMEVLKSDNSSGFTLNWGPDTSKLDASLTYDNKAWSFDTLWRAGDQGILVKNGAELPPVVLSYGKDDVVVGEDGSVTVNVNFDYATSIQGIDWGTASVDVLDFFVYDGDNIIPFAINAGNGQFVDYGQIADISDFASAVDVSKAAEGVVSVTITPEYASYLAENVGGVYIGADYDLTIGGYATENNVLSTILLAFAE